MKQEYDFSKGERGKFYYHLKLQKLLYYVEAWHLAILDCELIPDKFEAWMHVPVLRNR